MPSLDHTGKDSSVLSPYLFNILVEMVTRETIDGFQGACRILNSFLGMGQAVYSLRIACALQSGADVKLRDHEGFSAAYYAQMSGSVDCVGLLHSLGSPLHTVVAS